MKATIRILTPILFVLFLLVASVGLASARESNEGTVSRPRTAGEVEISGALQAMNGDAWTIAGRAVRVTAQTELKNAFQIGDLVKVHALSAAGGSLLAREIELAAASVRMRSGDDGRSMNDDKNPASSMGGADDPANHDAGDDHRGLSAGNGADDPANHDAGDDRGGQAGGHETGEHHGGRGGGRGGADDPAGHH